MTICRTVSRPSTNKRAYFTWLRQRTAEYHFALKQPCWDHELTRYKQDDNDRFILEPRPINTNDRILSVLTSRKSFLYKMTNLHYQDHLEGNDTYYFQGNGRPSAPETLVMIDIDCRKSLGLGSKQGAHQFAAFLRACKESCVRSVDCV
jgi:hypothetical protein